MSQAQKKILGIITDMITEHGLEPVKKGNWANTGTISLEKAGSFGRLASVSYDFQQDRFTLSIHKIVNGQLVGVPSQPPRQGYFDHYLPYSDVSGFATFQRHLTEVMNEIAPKPKVKKAAKKVASIITPPVPPVGSVHLRGAMSIERWGHYKGKLRHICVMFDESDNALFYVDGVLREVPVD
jgi:hypothetical protein